MPHAVTRRGLIKGVLGAGTLVPALGLFSNQSTADTLTPLDVNEPGAKALNFVADASKIDVHANPTYKPGQRCALCAHYRGKPTETLAGCEIFTTHSVPAGGWCLVWGARSS